MHVYQTKHIKLNAIIWKTIFFDGEKQMETSVLMTREGGHFMVKAYNIYICVRASIYEANRIKSCKIKQ